MRLTTNFNAATVGIGSKLMNGFNVLNTVTMPLMMAPLFIPDATTRLQAKLQKQLVGRPDVASAMGKTREVAEGIGQAGTQTVNGVMSALPKAPNLSPPAFQPNSLRGQN